MPATRKSVPELGDNALISSVLLLDGLLLQAYIYEWETDCIRIMFPNGDAICRYIECYTFCWIIYYKKR